LSFGYLLNKKYRQSNSHLPKQRINSPKTAFLYPVAEYEIKRVINLKGKFSSGCDDIPEYLTKRSMIQKETVVHICNAPL
jgi:hypothetical protein